MLSHARALCNSAHVLLLRAALNASLLWDTLACSWRLLSTLLTTSSCECKSASYNALSGRHKYWTQHGVNMPCGSGSVDKAPDSQWTNASSKLERRKHSFITAAAARARACGRLCFSLLITSLNLRMCLRTTILFTMLINFSMYYVSNVT